MNLKPWQIARDIIEGGVVISTAEPIIMAWYGDYETAVSLDGQMSWKILEGYDTKEEALKGHEKYKNMSIRELAELEGL